MVLDKSDLIDLDPLTDYAEGNKGQLMFEMEPIPCKCGIKHEYGDGNYEFYDLKMVTDASPFQVPPRKTARCKYCKDTLLVGRKPEPDRLKRLDTQESKATVGSSDESGRDQQK